MSVPVRATPGPNPAAITAPAVDAGPWSDPGGDSPALALQRRLATEWSPVFAMPVRSPMADRVESTIVAASRIGGPMLFGAALAGIASLLT